MASLHALQSWYSGIPKQRKLQIYGWGTLAAFAALLVRQYNRRQKVLQSRRGQQQQQQQQQSAFRIMIPLSGHKMFWGSYLFSACTLLVVFSSRVSSFCQQHVRIPSMLRDRLNNPFADLLPPLPRTLSQAFKLGQIESILARLEGSSGSAAVAVAAQESELLSNAAQVLGQSITGAQLHDIVGRMVSHETRQSLMQRVGGTLKFVNIMWLLSIVGIAGTTLPVVYFLGKPVWDELYNFCKRFFTRASHMLRKLLFHRNALHLYELAGYSLCWYITYCGLQSTSNCTVGLFTCLTGIAMWVPMVYVSDARHNIYARNNYNVSNEVANVMFSLFASALTIPIAYRFESPKLAMVSVASAYFYACAVLKGMRLVSLFDILIRDDAAVPVAVSALINVALVSIKMMGVDTAPFNMFVQPLCVFGSTGVYGALLACTYRDRYSYRHGHFQLVDYWSRQYLMMLSLFAGVGFGQTLNLPALSSTATVFTGFYGVQKFLEMDHLWDGKNFFFSAFASSVATWRLALYLHQNPSVIANMYKFE